MANFPLNINLIETIATSFNVSGSGKSADEIAREFIYKAAASNKTNTTYVYRELLRSMLNIFGNFTYVDSEQNIRRIKSIHANPERPVAKALQEDNIVLPIISVAQPTSNNDDKRRRYYPNIVAEKEYDPETQRARRVISLVPRALNVEYEISIWTKYKNDMDQIVEQIYHLFHPTTNIETPFSNQTQAFIKGERDESTVVTGDREDRVIRKKFLIEVQTYVPSPKFLFTSTGKIEEIVLDSCVVEEKPDAVQAQEIISTTGSTQQSIYAPVNADPVDYTPTNVTGNIYQRYNVFTPSGAVPDGGWPVLFQPLNSDFKASLPITSATLENHAKLCVENGIAYVSVGLNGAGQNTEIAIDNSGMFVPPFITDSPNDFWYQDDKFINFKDVTWAIRHFRHNAGTWNCNGQKIYGFGRSGGCTMCAFISHGVDRADPTPTTPTDDFLKESTRLQGMIFNIPQTYWPAINQLQGVNTSPPTAYVQFFPRTLDGPPYTTPSVALSGVDIAWQQAASVAHYGFENATIRALNRNIPVHITYGSQNLGSTDFTEDASGLPAALGVLGGANPSTPPVPSNQANVHDPWFGWMLWKQVLDLDFAFHSASSVFITSNGTTTGHSLSSLPFIANESIDDLPEHRINWLLGLLNGAGSEVPEDNTYGISSITPSSGGHLGGQPVTITGGGFQNDSTINVAFANRLATQVEILSDTSLSCLTAGVNANFAGTLIDVGVSNSGGVKLLNNGFNLYPTPVITSISPSGGPTSGNTVVTVSGTGFSDNSPGTNSVTFGGVSAVGVGTISDTQVSCLSPSGLSASTVDVVLGNNNGNYQFRNSFTFTGASPTPSIAISSIDPSSGTSLGGTAVTFSGIGFVGTLVTRVAFDGVLGTNTMVISDTQVSSRTPAGTAGLTVDAVVFNDNGVATETSGFKYNAIPTITQLIPTTGDSAGGTSLTVCGTGFLEGNPGDNIVTLGGLTPGNLSATADTKIICSSPRGTLGTSADLVVANNNGTATLNNAFLYTSSTNPSLVSVFQVSSASGTPLGGTNVAIIGQNYTLSSPGDFAVKFGNNFATNVSAFNNTTLLCTTPSGTPSSFVVVTASSQNNGQGSLGNGFFYYPNPSVVTIFPNSGPEAGGGNISVFGGPFQTNESGQNFVSMGDNLTSSVTIINDGRISITIPPGTGTVGVVVSNNNGSGVSPTDYTYT